MVIEDYNYNDFPAVAFAARIDGRDQDTFVPAAKLVANGECFSIISDYLGTPLQAYDKQGLGTRAGHLRPAKKTAIRVHSIQIPRAVRGCGDRTVL